MKSDVKAKIYDSRFLTFQSSGKQNSVQKDGFVKFMRQGVVFHRLYLFSIRKKTIELLLLVRRKLTLCTICVSKYSKTIFLPTDQNRNLFV